MLGVSFYQHSSKNHQTAVAVGRAHRQEAKMSSSGIHGQEHTAVSARLQGDGALTWLRSRKCNGINYQIKINDLS